MAAVGKKQSPFNKPIICTKCFAGQSTNRRETYETSLKISESGKKKKTYSWITQYNKENNALWDKSTVPHSTADSVSLWFWSRLSISSVQNSKGKKKERKKETYLRLRK